MSAYSVIICEESLKSERGHWYSYLAGIADAASRLNISVDIACHRQASAAVLARFSAIPKLTRSRYLDGGSGIFGRGPLHWLAHNVRTFVDLWRILRGRARYDLAIVPTASAHQLLAWFLLMRIWRRAPLRLVLLFVTPPDSIHSEQSTRSLGDFVLARVLRGFRRLCSQGRVTLAAETPSAADAFNKLTSLNFTLVTHPVSMPSQLRGHIGASRTHASNGLIIGAYGFARYEKGSDLVQEAFATLAEDHAETSHRFIMQWHRGFTMPTGSKCELNPELLSRHNVTVLRHTMDEQSYTECLAQTHLLVLPYRGASYRARLSRVAIEAMCAGIPMVYTGGDWLEYAIARHGAGVAMRAESAGALVEAINTAIDNYESLSLLARERMIPAQDFYSPDSFWHSMLASARRERPVVQSAHNERSSIS